MARAIGIDLGTTNTVVATIEGGRPRIVLNAEGQHLTPSVVAFAAGGEPLVGQPARARAATDPDRAVSSIKRRMGTGYRVPIGDERYSPQTISSLILRKVKADAEAQLGEPIERAVITVPAYFNDRQRQATREAAALAGLDVLRIVNEPTAAALAYGLDREDAHTILVWDLGGGTFDVSILELGDGVFEVRAVSGDSHLGGDDFDALVADYLATEYRRQTGVALPANEATRWRLRVAAERAKIALSSALAVRVPLSDGAHRRRVGLSRAQLESLSAGLLRRMAVCTEQALADAALLPVDISRVILVGGATRMPAVRELARRLLGKEPYRYINPDEVVAAGAAIQAGMLLDLVERAVLLDVLPLSLGVETQGGLVGRIIARNTPLPVAASRIFTTAADYQTAMRIHVLQGERALATDNVSLGEFGLTGIPAAQRGVAKVEVSFEADVDGMIRVSATDLLTEGEMKVSLAATKLLDVAEIADLVEQAQRSAERDRLEQERVQAAIEAENAIAAADIALEELQRTAPDHWAGSVAETRRRLATAIADGATAEMRTLAAELRESLAAVQRRRRAASIAVSIG